MGTLLGGGILLQHDTGPPPLVGPRLLGAQAHVGPGPYGPGRSRFRPNVRISGRTFEFPVERSNSRSNVRNKNWSLGSKNGLPEFFVEGKWIFWIRTLICRGQKYKILSKNCQKWPKIFFTFPKNYKIIWNYFKSCKIIWKILVRVTLV